MILLDFLLIFIDIIQLKMGYTKKTYEKAIEDFIAHLYPHAEGDEDYSYELHKEAQNKQFERDMTISMEGGRVYE